MPAGLDRTKLPRTGLGNRLLPAPVPRNTRGHEWTKTRRGDRLTEPYGALMDAGTGWVKARR